MTKRQTGRSYHDHVKSRLVTGTLWAMGGRVISGLSLLAMTILLSRLLSPHEFAIYLLFLNFIGIASVAAQAGLNRSVVRLIAESLAENNVSRAAAIFRKATLLTTLSVIVITLVLWSGVGSWIIEQIIRYPADTFLILALSGWIGMTAAAALSGEMFRGAHDMRSAAIFSGSALNFLTLVGMFILALLYKLDVQSIVAVSFYCASLIVIIAYALLFRRYRHVPLTDNITYRYILKISFPIFLTTLTLYVLTQADLWIINAFGTRDQVALYGAAARIVILLSMPLVIINAVIQPLIAEMHTQGRKAYLEKFLRSISGFIGVPTLLILFAVIIFREDVMVFLFGSFYQNAAPVLAILLLGSVMGVFAGASSMALMMTGHEVALLVTSLISGVITILLAFYMVTAYGMIGVALARSAGLTLHSICLWLLAKNRLGIWTHMGGISLRMISELRTIVPRNF